MPCVELAKLYALVANFRPPDNMDSAGSSNSPESADDQRERVQRASSYESSSRFVDEPSPDGEITGVILMFDHRTLTTPKRTQT